MAIPTDFITISRAAIFDPSLLENGRYVISATRPINIEPDAFIDGIAEQPALFVSNSILVIQQYTTKATVDLENLPDNLEFLYQNVNDLFFIIKGDCDIPLIPVQNQEMV